MEAVLERDELETTRAALSLRVLADARRSFAADVDPVTLERDVHEVVAQLWTDSTKVTTFILVLALRALRERIEHRHEPPLT